VGEETHLVRRIDGLDRVLFEDEGEYPPRGGGSRVLFE
jgi:hypothetical protein